MDILLILGALIFTAWYSFDAGTKYGNVAGMLGMIEFLKTKRALKNQASILGFKNWPVTMQELFNSDLTKENDNG